MSRSAQRIRRPLLPESPHHRDQRFDLIGAEPVETRHFALAVADDCADLGVGELLHGLGAEVLCAEGLAGGVVRVAVEAVARRAAPAKEGGAVGGERGECGGQDEDGSRFHRGEFILIVMTDEKKGWGNTVLGWFVVREGDTALDALNADGASSIGDSLVDAADARSRGLPLPPPATPRAKGPAAPAASPRSAAASAANAGAAKPAA